MDSNDFLTLAKGDSVQAAFDSAREEKAWEEGHGGYSGTIAEKDSFRLLSDRVLTEVEATALAVNLMGADDPRIADKRGPAGAYAVSMGTRTVRVSGFAWNSDGQSIEEAVAGLVTLRRGETIERVNLTSYSTPRGHYGYSSRGKTDCTADVVIALPAVSRSVTVEVTVPADAPGTGTDQAMNQAAAARKIAREKVRLRKGESIVTTRATTRKVASAKTSAVAPKAKPVTRYLVLGLMGRDTWATGFATQAQARAWAVEQIETQYHRGDVEVVSMTRREDGQALVKVTREVKTVTIAVEVLIDLGKKRPAADAWLFFGYASS